MSDNTPNALKKGLRGVAVVLVIIALSLVAISRSDVGREAIADLLQRTDPLGLLLALAVMTAGLTFLALRWRALIPEGEKLPVAGLTGIISAGLLLNFALPGPAGELAVAYMVQRRYGVQLTHALAGGVHARFLGLAVAGVLAAAAWLLGDMPVPPDGEPLLMWGTITIAGGAIALGLLSHRPALLIGLSRATAGRLGGLPGRLGTLFNKLDEAVHKVAHSLGLVGELSWRRRSWATLWALGGHLCVIGGIIIATWAMGIDAYLPGVVFTYGAATAGIVILIAVPGGHLGWDALFLSLFHVTTGVPLTDAVAITLTVRIQQLVLLLMGAASLTLLSGGSYSGEPSTSETEA